MCAQSVLLAIAFVSFSISSSGICPRQFYGDRRSSFLMAWATRGSTGEISFAAGSIYPFLTPFLHLMMLID